MASATCRNVRRSRQAVNDLVANHYNSKLGYGGPYKCNCCSVRPLDENYDTDMSLVAEKFGKLL